MIIVCLLSTTTKCKDFSAEPEKHTNNQEESRQGINPAPKGVYKGLMGLRGGQGGLH